MLNFKKVFAKTMFWILDAISVLIVLMRLNENIITLFIEKSKLILLSIGILI